MVDTSKKIKNADSLTNAITGMGTKLDKGFASRFTQDPEMSQDELEAMYRSNWVCGKVIDVPANDMIREWRTWNDFEEDEVQMIEQGERALKYQQKLNEAIKWARLYGGSAILLKVEDGKHPSEPLEVESLKEGCFKYMAVVDRYELSPNVNVVTDPMNLSFRMPDSYIIGGQTIHHSRVIRFEGVDLPRNIKMRTDYWGDSVLFRVREDLINSGTVNKAIASLFHEANIDVLKIPGLMHMVGDCDGERQLMKRLQAANLSKSIHNMFIMDANEEYEKKGNSITGLNTVIYDFMTIVAGATDIPLTKLLGTSPGGMNATGDSDIRNYYDRIKADQEANLRDSMEYIDNILLMSTFGMLPDNRGFEFNPLWQLSELEQATVDNLRADRDTKYKGMIPDSSILKKVQLEGTYDINDDIIRELEQMEAAGSEEIDPEPELVPVVEDPELSTGNEGLEVEEIE